MKPYRQPSALHNGLDLLIDSRRSPDQALAVIELLDDLRGRIWAHHDVSLPTELRETRVTRRDVRTTEPPF